MKAGRELDALVAEKMMGWHNNAADPSKPGMWGIMDYYPDGRPVLVADFPKYSTDIAAAWEVIEKLQSLDWNFILDDMCPGKTYQAHFEKDREVHRVTDVETAPLAICLAALKAVGG